MHVNPERRVVLVPLDMEMLLTMLLPHNEPLRYTLDGLPDDARVLSWDKNPYDPMRVTILVESATFAPVLEGNIPPMLWLAVRIAGHEMPPHSGLKGAAPPWQT